MKFFMPVYAVALTLAVTSDMFEQVSATVCVKNAQTCPFTSPATIDTVCPPVANGVTPTPLARPATTVLASCTPGTNAYISKLTIFPDAGTPAVTDDSGAVTTAAVVATVADNVKVRISKTAATVDTGATAETRDTVTSGYCENQFINLGKADATADVKASIGCAANTQCKFAYKVDWACQVYTACDAATICTGTACTSVSTTASAVTTTGALTRPATTVLGTCAEKKFAYVKKLQIFAGAAQTSPVVDATSVDDIKVTMSKDGTDISSTAIALTKDNYPACANQFSNIGSDATGDVKVAIGCASGTVCNFKYKIEWGCQGDSFAPTPAPTSGVAGTCTAAAWGTALVAAVAGANIAAPL